jgi:drug/metabolite transporter (DMT)-like permease
MGPPPLESRPMFPTFIGLSGAFIFGAGDFLGGLAAKRISAIRVTGIAAFSGLLFLLVMYPVAGGAVSPGAVYWGALSGIAGALAISLIYASLAIGPMSILSPLTAIIGAIVPAAVGIMGGRHFEVSGYIGIGLVLIAVVLVGFVPERGAVRPSLRGLSMAAGAGLMVGAFFLLIDQAPRDSGIVPLIANRIVNSSLMGLTVLVLGLVARRRRLRGVTLGVGSVQPKTGVGLGPAPSVGVGVGVGNLRLAILLAAACGVVDVSANILLIFGIHLGELTLMAVLTSMYPAGTILLAAIVLRERIAPVQILGLILALAAAALLATA